MLGQIKDNLRQWLKVSQLKTGMRIAVPRAQALVAHGGCLANDAGLEVGEGDIMWDEIVEIKKVGEEKVYDIEVEGTHNFVAGHLLAAGKALTAEEERTFYPALAEGSAALAASDGKLRLPSGLKPTDPALKGGRITFGGIFAHNTYITDNVGIGTSAPTRLFEIATTTVDWPSGARDLFRVATGTTEALYVTKHGNVGIGTTAPTAKLGVLGTASSTNLIIGETATITGQLVVGLPTGGGQGAGTINAQAVYDDSVILTDYVFEDGYQLTSIPEMTNYYQTYKHLPTILSRDEFETKRPSAGQLINQIWETVEVQARYISELDARSTRITHELSTNNNTNLFTNNTNTTSEPLLPLSPISPLSPPATSEPGMSRLDDLEIRVMALENQLTKINVGIGIDDDPDKSGLNAPDAGGDIVVVDQSEFSAATITVSQAANFYGTITVKGEASFESKVVFKDKVYFDADTAGTALIMAGATSTEVIFVGEYEVVPKVVANQITNFYPALAEGSAALAASESGLNPTDPAYQGGRSDEDIFVQWKITDKTIKGFRIILKEPAPGDLAFDWVAIATNTNDANINTNNTNEGSEPANNSNPLQGGNPEATTEPGAESEVGAVSEPAAEPAPAPLPPISPLSPPEPEPAPAVESEEEAGADIPLPPISPISPLEGEPAPEPEPEPVAEPATEPAAEPEPAPATE